MKKVILTAALALVSVLGFSQQIAYVNYLELVQLCPDADAVRAKMDEALKVNNEVFEEMRAEYQSKLEQYNKNKDSWSTSILNSKQTELAQFEERIQQTYSQMQMELQQKQQELMTPVEEKVRGVVADLAKSKGIVYVFGDATLVYFDEAKAVCLTKEARKLLNIPDSRTIESLQQELQAQAQSQMQQ